MIAVHLLLGLYATLAVLHWLWTARAMVRTLRDVPVLTGVDPPVPADLPKLSLVLAACDEQDEIEAADAFEPVDRLLNLLNIPEIGHTIASTLGGRTSS